MAMVDIVNSSLAKRPRCLAWSESRQPLGAVLHSSDEPGELKKHCHELLLLLLLLLLCRISLPTTANKT